MIFRRLPVTGPGYLPPVADEAGRTGPPPTSDGAGVTCGRYALGEFTITPRSPLDDERPPGLLGGRYEVGRLIGSGATARVYRAYDVRLTREVAVKIYDRDAVALDQRRRLREMTIQGSISHPGVVALLDSGDENGRTYLVMQLVEGENLAERLLSGPMPAADVTALADGLAEALAHVHARRIVHRDLKPANVFLSADGPLIGDFGIAHALDTTHITGTGLIPGTAAYLAPEQVSGEPAGPPADVYALGLILLECLTGQREYPGTMVEAAMARLTRPPRIPEDAPAALAYTLRRMTQREPADRPTAAKVLDMLHAPPPTLPWSRVERSPRWRRRPARQDAGSAPAPGGLGRAAADASPAADAALAASGSAGHGLPATDPAPTHRSPSTGHDRTAADAPTQLHPVTATAPPADSPKRRRLAAAAGLTAAAVAAVSALLLVEQQDGTSSPAQPPAAHTPVATATPSSTPLAESGTPAPHSDAGGRGPATSGAASLEPAAVTHETPASAGQPPKQGKPEKPENPGKGKGKGPGHDS
ncbi:serine/threonine protein kinase [Amycolatopsis sp. DG1A-15b]|uniref:serine/threonine-protein kinase n=1 Tax=Amycolatopsis sp. DG1A-15b TaxID=3052846 RepID=UPI00255B78F3|nr:serine/threonine protein kinase [Amycolatopsis sp. DG1A-15b]WIX92719.1 protein kinase [Amycolatopsis sp. DG1A-15b]